MTMRNLASPATLLPLRILPLPWEDLASFLSRTARNMGYEQPKWLLQPENSPYHLREDALAWLCRTEDFLYLEHLLSLDEETIYLMTLHRFAPMLQHGSKQSVPQKTTLIARALLSDRSPFAEPLYTKVCPACLDQPNGYDRLYWRAAFILLCPDHMLPLRTNCPQCKKRIPALRALLAQCPFCKLGDYHAPVASMPEESMLWRGELLLFRALGVPSPQINTPADMFTDAPLLGLCPMDYFHLYRSMTRTLSHLFWPEDILKLCLNLHVLTQEEMATHSMLYGASQAPEVVLFHALFSRWPHNFFLFLDIVYQAFILGDHFEEVLRGFHALFEEELRGEAFAWVLQAYRDHLEQFQREKRARAESEALSACTIPLPGSIRQSIERKREVLHTMQEGWSGFHEWLALRERCIRQAEEQEQAKRRRIQELLPLPRRVVPQPWENLASVITRAAQVMGYSQPGWILRPEKAGYSIPREALPPVVIKWVMKWSRYCGVGKLGLYSSTEGDEQYAKGTTNVYKRVQAGSHTFGEDKRQEY